METWNRFEDMRTDEALRFLDGRSEVSQCEASRRMGRSRRYVEAALARGETPLLSTFADACEAYGAHLMLKAPDGHWYRLLSPRACGAD